MLSILKPVIFIAGYKYLPEEAYGKICLFQRADISESEQVKLEKKICKKPCRQADLDIEAQEVLEKWKAWSIGELIIDN